MRKEITRRKRTNEWKEEEDHEGFWLPSRLLMLMAFLRAKD